MASTGWKLYVRNWLVALDRWVNTWFGGSDLETMSSRVCRYKDSNIVAHWVYLILDKIEYRHCELSLEPDDHWKGKEVLK